MTPSAYSHRHDRSVQARRKCSGAALQTPRARACNCQGPEQQSFTLLSFCSPRITEHWPAFINQETGKGRALVRRVRDENHDAFLGRLVIGIMTGLDQHAE